MVNLPCINKDMTIEEERVSDLGTSTSAADVTGVGATFAPEEPEDTTNNKQRECEGSSYQLLASGGDRHRRNYHRRW